MLERHIVFRLCPVLLHIPKHNHVLDSVSRENGIPNFYLRVNFVYTELKQMCVFITLKMHICKTSDSIFIRTDDWAERPCLHLLVPRTLFT